MENIDKILVLLHNMSGAAAQMCQAVSQTAALVAEILEETKAKAGGDVK